jgi:hypothetical protein
MNNDDKKNRFQPSLYKQFKANMKKRFRYSTRDLFAISCDLIFPVLFLILGLVFVKIGISNIENIPILS